MLVRLQRSIEMEKTLSHVGYALQHNPLISRAIIRTCDYLAANLNPEIVLGSYGSGRKLVFCLLWEGNVSQTPGRPLLMIAGSCPIGWSQFKRSPKPDEAFKFLKKLRKKVKGYRNITNPSTAFIRSIMPCGYRVAPMSVPYPPGRAARLNVRIPDGLTVGETLEFAQKKFRSPIKRIAVYQYLAELVEASDAAVLCAYVMSEGDLDARRELAKLADSFAASSQPSSPTRRRL